MKNRASNRLMRSRNQNTLQPDGIKVGDEVLMFIRSRQQKSNIVEARDSQKGFPHYVEATSENEGPPARISYEDIRLLPNSDLTKELMTASSDTISDEEGETVPSSLQISTSMDNGSMNVTGQEDSAIPIASKMTVRPPERQMEGHNKGSAPSEGHYKDLGEYVASTGDIAGKTIQSDDGSIVETIKEKIGKKWYRVLLYRLHHHGLLKRSSGKRYRPTVMILMSQSMNSRLRSTQMLYPPTLCSTSKRMTTAVCP